MIKSILMSVLVLAVGLTQRAEAVPSTTILNEASNVIAVAFADTNFPAKTHALLGKALNDLQKPSTSVLGDYNIFVAVASHLLPLSGQPGGDSVSNALSSAFVNFLVAAQTQFVSTTNRIAALSQFQAQKRGAATQVTQAQKAMTSALNALDVNNTLLALLQVQQVFTKLATANKLAAAAEARPDFAPNSVAGHELAYTSINESGTITFTDGTNYTEETRAGTYTYTHKGLSSALLVLKRMTPDARTTSATLKFLSATNGTFKATSPHSRTETGSFVLSQ